LAKVVRALASTTASVLLKATAVSPLNCALRATSGESFTAMRASVFFTTR
jgi:hypothetical protein